MDLGKLKFNQLEDVSGQGLRWQIKPMTFETKNGKFHCWWVFRNTLYPIGSLTKSGNVFKCSVNPKHVPNKNQIASLYQCCNYLNEERVFDSSYS